MCEYCRSFPHRPGCPNEPKPKGHTFCADCGEPIYENEDYVEVNGVAYHEICLEVMPTRNIIEALGHEIKTMEE